MGDGDGDPAVGSGEALSVAYYRSAAMQRWFDVYAFPLGAAEDRRVALLFTDISERRQVERDLRASEAVAITAYSSVLSSVWAGPRRSLRWHRPAPAAQGRSSSCSNRGLGS